MELSGFNVPTLLTILHTLVPLVIALVWPATMLIIVRWFRSELKELIGSVTELKLFNSVSLRIERARTDIAERPTDETLDSPEAKQISEPSTPKWGKVANLFWLGNDLEWTMQTLLQNAPQQRIVKGFIQVNHHCSELGLADSTPGKQLAELKAQVESLSEAALDKRLRDDLAEKLLLVVKGFDVLVRRQQRDFRPSPES
jgi:hypothetical protein